MPTEKRRCLILLIALSLAVEGKRALPNQIFPFRNVTADSGIEFRLENFPTPERYLIETIMGGCAFLDYDGDGLLDIFLVNGAAIQVSPGKPPHFDKSEPRYWNRLYRNLGGGRFQDVTEQAGVRGTGYGMGVAVGDYDNDGSPDLYVTNYGQNELFHNETDGTFQNVTAVSGVGAGGFSTSAAFLDFDRDGFLDLYVARYVDWSFENNRFCGTPETRDYCHPDYFDGVPDLLFRNNGDSTFTDVSTTMGIALPSGKGLGVAIGDMDRDGWLDIYVANDSVPCFLFRNRKGEAFEEIGLSSSSSHNADGEAFSGMGVDFADYDDDGWPDIFVTALSLEGFVLFRNREGQAFSDVAEHTGVKKASYVLSGWGTKFLDFNNDGWKDLFVANGHVMRHIQARDPTVRYAQPFLMLENVQGVFVDVTAAAGPVFQQPWAGRGAAFGDYDNDGDVDILVQVLGGRPQLLENLAGSKNHWLGLELVGTKSNHDAIGATIRTLNDRGESQYFMVHRTSSYLASNDPRIIVGLKDAEVASIEITWPSGQIQKLIAPAINRYIRNLREMPQPQK